VTAHLITRAARRIEAHLDRAASEFRIFASRLTGARIGNDCLLRAGAEARVGSEWWCRGTIEVGDRCSLERGALLHPCGGTIYLGRNVFLGPCVVIYGQGGVDIGDDTLIASHTQIFSSNHQIPPIDTQIRSVSDELLPTTIGRDVWLGAGVIVLGGVHIGDHCVVGAGAVVSSDLESAAIAVGNPARVIGKRDRSTVPGHAPLG
jgi:acetyltransferase-like isoleucine patch superfamily enzyme